MLQQSPKLDTAIHHYAEKYHVSYNTRQHKYKASITSVLFFILTTALSVFLKSDHVLSHPVSFPPTLSPLMYTWNDHFKGFHKWRSVGFAKQLAIQIPVLAQMNGVGMAGNCVLAIWYSA